MNEDNQIPVEIIKTPPPVSSYFKTLSAVLGIFVLVTGLGVAIRLTQQSQDNRTKALVPTPTPSPFTIIKKGDANKNNTVDYADYIIWLSGSVDADFNEDGKVDGIDYSLWLNNYL